MIVLDLSAFEAAAGRTAQARKQVPFAVAGALNDSAFAARSEFINTTWPSAVQVRNRGFMRAALKVETANKQKLEAAVTNQGPAGNRGFIALHAKGGVKRAKHKFAIPGPDMQGRRTSRGIPARLRPKDLPRSFRIGQGIFQRTGKGKRSGIRLMYVLSPSSTIRPTVPFARDFDRVVRQTMRVSYPKRLAMALATRKR